MKLLSSLVCLSTALAATAATASMETHYVVGASAGYVDQSGSWGANDGAGVPGEVAGDIDNSGFLYGVFAGLETRCNKWIVGLEFGIDWYTDSDVSTVQQNDIVTQAQNNYRASFDRDTVYSLSTRIGYEVCPWLVPYARVGVETSRDYLDIAGSAVSPAPQNRAFGDNFYADGSNRRFAWLLGLGLEFPVDQYLPNSTLRVEYNFHAKGEGVTAKGFSHFPNPAFAPMTGIPVAGHGSQHAHSIRASLAYNFL